MPAYWIARSRITDPGEYRKYTDLVPAIIARFGGKVLARGGRYRIMEGPEKFHRFVVIEFPTLERAAECFESAEYREAAAFRRAGAGEVENVIVEGVDPVPARPPVSSIEGVSMEYVIPAPQVPTLPVEGSEARFPVARIFCVGRNYAEHAREMGHDPNREPPFFFMKPATAVCTDGRDFPYPSQTKDVHHEMELVVALGKGGANIAESAALEHVYGYAVGLDMTRRDLQGEAKKAGRPWDTGKAFDHSAPCSALVPAARIGHPSKGAVLLEVNGEVRQKGDLGELIWKIPEMIAYLSTLFTLMPGDLIFTGTPAGVGPVKKGDTLAGSVEGVGRITLKVV
jgi:fumarylpyruvate hydrolase